MTTRNLVYSFATLVACAISGRGQGLPYPIFQDVPATAPYFHQVNLLRERLITAGCSFSPQKYCPETNLDGATPYYLDRGQMAVLIVRSLFSALSGDPENFTYPSTPYFTDVDSNHGQFKYVQKLKELGITSGCSETKFCPERVISYAELSVFVYRARYKRMAGNASAAVPDPPACQVNPFYDVPFYSWYCPWVKAVTDVIGTSAVATDCSGRPSYFCPEVTLKEGQYLWGLRVRRGTTAFYLVNGVLNADNPQSLPTSQGDVPSVDLAGTTSECDYSGIGYSNYVTVVGSQLYGSAYTVVDSFTNSNLWNFYVSSKLRQNLVVLHTTTNMRAGSAAQLFTPSVLLDATKNYEHPADHEIASACLAGGYLTQQTVPWPTLFSANQTVLYRGMNQTLTFRGTTLQGTQQAYMPAAGSQAIIPSTVSNASQFESTVSFTTPLTAPPGQTYLFLLALHNGGPGTTNNPVQVTVADPTPVLSSLTPSSGMQGTTVQATISGNYFGGNPTVCIMFGQNCLQTYNGVSVSWNCTNCTAQINATLTIASNAVTGPLSIAVRSNGPVPLASFMPGPGGSTQPLSGTLAFQIQPASVSNIRLQLVDFDSGNFVTSYRATGSDYVSEANTSQPLTNRVYYDQQLTGSPVLAPAAFRLFNNQSTPLSRRPKLSVVILRVLDGSAFSMTLRITSSNAKMQFPDVPITFSNGEGRVEGIESTVQFSAIDNYTTTLSFSLLFNPQSPSLVASFSMPVYVLFDLPRVFPDVSPAPGLVYPSVSSSITDRRIALVTQLASGLTSASAVAEELVEAIAGRYTFGPGSISSYSFNAWNLYNQPGVLLDCISHSLVAAAITNLLGVQTNVAFAFPTVDGDALSQDTRFIGEQQRLRFYPPNRNVANDFEGYLETLADGRAYTVVPSLLNIPHVQASIINGTSAINQRAFSVMFRMIDDQEWEQWWTTGATPGQATKVANGQAGFPYP